MPQFLAQTIDAATGRVVLAEGEDRHLLLSHRGRIGETVWVFDGKGTRARAIIESAGRGGTVLRLSGSVLPPSAPARARFLVQGIPSRAAFETIITAAVELGVDRIVPVLAERTVRSPRGLGDRSGRWRSLVLAAAKQCLRADLPPVDEPLGLAEALQALPGAFGIALTGPDAAPLSRLVRGVPSGVPFALAVGPEGGWTEREIELLTARGFRHASLGPLILRCETAAQVALGIARAVDPAESGG